jgi:hypothetical protein
MSYDSSNNVELRVSSLSTAVGITGYSFNLLSGLKNGPVVQSTGSNFACSSYDKNLWTDPGFKEQVSVNPPLTF